MGNITTKLTVELEIRHKESISRLSLMEGIMAQFFTPVLDKNGKFMLLDDESKQRPVFLNTVTVK